MKVFLNPMKINQVIIQTPNSLEGAPWIGRKRVKNIENTNIGIRQNPQLVSRIPLRVLNIPNLEALNKQKCQKCIRHTIKHYAHIESERGMILS